MKRNWKLIQEILKFLTLSKNKKEKEIGCTTITGESVLIKDEHYLKFEELAYGDKCYFSDTSEIIKAKESSKSFLWDNDLLYYHVDLLVEIKAIKIITEDIEEEIKKEKWDEGCYGYANYDELLYLPLEDYYPSFGVYKDVKFHQITWVGIELLDILTKVENDGIDLFTFDQSIPLVTGFINPLISSDSKKKKPSKKKESICGV
jgi:hypothetical protein